MGKPVPTFTVCRGDRIRTYGLLATRVHPESHRKFVLPWREQDFMCFRYYSLLALPYMLSYSKRFAIFRRVTHFYKLDWFIEIYLHYSFDVINTDIEKFSTTIY